MKLPDIVVPSNASIRKGSIALQKLFPSTQMETESFLIVLFDPELLEHGIFVLIGEEYLQAGVTFGAVEQRFLEPDAFDLVPESLHVPELSKSCIDPFCLLFSAQKLLVTDPSGPYFAVDMNAYFFTDERRV